MTSGDHPTAPGSGASGIGHDRPCRYEICVRAHLGPRLAAWFDGLDLAAHDDGTTVISGPVVDQAALYGLLQRLRDVGIPLVSLTEMPDDSPTSSTGVPNQPQPNTTQGATS